MALKNTFQWPKKMHRRLGTRKEPNSLYISGVIWNLDWFCGGRLAVLKNFCNFTKVSYCWGFSWAKRFGGQNRRCKNTNWIVSCTNKHNSLHDLYIKGLWQELMEVYKKEVREIPHCTVCELVKITFTKEKISIRES